MTHIFSYRLHFQLISKAPEISAGVNEVTKESLQDEIRKAKALALGKVLTGAVFVHFSLSAQREMKGGSVRSH